MEKIECEQVTIEVPKQVMELLRNIENINGISPKEYIERTMINSLSADLNGQTIIQAKDVVDKLNLSPIFKEYNVPSPA